MCMYGAMGHDWRWCLTEEGVLGLVALGAYISREGKAPIRYG